jgi:DNA mismatch repair ATPase MutL
VDKPIIARAEVIPNALDADATEVRLIFHENALGGLQTTRVIDNGTGMHHALAVCR